ncbi:MAG: hypothetical protein A2W52_00715 [Candidatus Taylorbacteria bacterium RIFCSPHIGHO2_02_49_25]|uniref:Uncharacterized protein n=1 Tax=Candidatus Taylorbacteria bacterium RIFCSPHIGHO2_02_49_25 TaxID=1802305 RepID=A0A1G2MB69_9BACT|nr:MAG: hypothetical protein UY62_C0028G0008 [Parcubacteria group bacterium GW2011_GWF2_50_9]OHA21150.1 MAG: hypothetical protein A2W52_00715 [Candidatus Taylorbacteria bacterium RIFCSPHIGHO2_02_49_25]OHA21340.1 MAG: hypothetical protein A2759_02445 [Candidatus Taylorbacteria bacterium RIFCSPHIGHO2_01_FULL_49_60]OHA37594.1 MAG: hypothetical protein A2W65_02075 [Candidatus Taylorbacteria bacterium RIFCSPLOWO2_02_50_13]OHA45939.1 MAG: hypothetical protein A3G61_00145 [Candidatus Taylorbacteria ba
MFILKKLIKFEIEIWILGLLSLFILDVIDPYGHFWPPFQEPLSSEGSPAIYLVVTAAMVGLIFFLVYYFIFEKFVKNKIVLRVAFHSLILASILMGWFLPIILFFF